MPDPVCAEAISSQTTVHPVSANLQDGREPPDLYVHRLHRNAGLTPPNISPLVFRAVKKINRVAVVTGERTGQAVPFRLEDLLKLDALWSDSKSKNRAWQSLKRRARSLVTSSSNREDRPEA